MGAKLNPFSSSTQAHSFVYSLLLDVAVERSFFFLINPHMF